MQRDEMKVQHPFARIAALRLAVAAIMVLSGCRRSGDAVREAVPRNPKEAASQLQRVFESAPPDLKRNADLASEAMRKGDYENAVVALQVIRSGQNVTLEQGIAIHHSAVAMEAKLINAMDAGDENARRAYEILKALKRN